MSMKELVRNIRDQFVSIILLGKRSVTVEGIQLALHHPVISKRMQYVLWRGYESDDAVIVSHTLNSEDKIIEIGSSIGFMAIYCQKILEANDYAMVEANEELVSLMRENFKLNGIKMKQLISAAIAAENGIAKFNIQPNFWSSSLLSRSKKEITVDIPTITLPTALTQLSFRPNTLIMDIEGAETQLPIEHFDLFEKLIIEFHPSLTGQQATDNLLEGIKNLGFMQTYALGATRAFERK